MKEGPILMSAPMVQIIPCAPTVAIWLEKELIRTLQPEHNRMMYERHTKVAHRELAGQGLA